MTEQDTERPLTRRELRLRAQAEELGVPVETLTTPVIADDTANAPAASASGRASDGFGAAQGGVAPRVAAPPVVEEPEIEISPFDEQGNPRSRREMRLLREQALLERQSQGGGSAVAPDTLTDQTQGSPEATTSPDSVGAESADGESAVAESAGAESVDPESADEAAGEDAAEAEHPPLPPIGLPPVLPEDTPAVTPDLGTHDAPTEPFSMDQLKEAEAAAQSESAAAQSDAAQNDAAAQSDAAQNDAADAASKPHVAEEGEASEGAADPPTEHTEGESDEPYSFPDIVPPEEWRSVFDDPATRVSRRQEPAPAGDFDDLITRAVTDEGTTGGLGSSALILPTLPEDTGGLTGPLGGTGQLFVTGSLKMPKSLGETGGQVAPSEMPSAAPASSSGETAGAEGVEPTFVGPQPVSATRAVSARVGQDAPVVSSPGKERSRVPLILAITGGSLLIIIVGFGVWGWTTGMFG